MASTGHQPFQVFYEQRFQCHTITRCFPIEQPIICPTHVHRINRYVAVPRYYSTHSTSEETVCPGQAAQGFQGTMNQNVNNFNM